LVLPSLSLRAYRPRKSIPRSDLPRTAIPADFEPTARPKTGQYNCRGRI